MSNAIGRITALCAFLWAAPLLAGSQCRLTGTVADSSGAALDGVTVVVTTPNMTTFRIALKSNPKGQWGLLLNDCTLTYHVTFEKEGFVAAAIDRKVPVNDAAVVDTKLLKASEARSGPGPSTAGAPGPSSSEQAILSFNSGVEAVHRGDKAEAEEKFLEAVKKNPDLPAGWQALAQLAYERKDWPKAVEYGRKAVDLDPSLTSLYPLLAEASKASGDTKGAAQWNARDAEANPESAATLYNKGIDAYNKGKMKDAEAALARAIAVKPDFANAHYYLGMAAFNQNEKALAREHLQKYLELDPNGKEAATAREILPLLK